MDSFSFHLTYNTNTATAKVSRPKSTISYTTRRTTRLLVNEDDGSSSKKEARGPAQNDWISNLVATFLPKPGITIHFTP